MVKTVCVGQGKIFPARFRFRKADCKNLSYVILNKRIKYSKIG